MSKQSLISAVVAILMPVAVFIFIGSHAYLPSAETSSARMTQAQTTNAIPELAPSASNPTTRLTAAR